MSVETHIVALGARTPVGLDAESTAAAVRAGISRVAEHPFLIDKTGAPLRCARDPAMASTMLGPNRLVELAVGSVSEAAQKTSARGSLPDNLPVFVAFPSLRPGVSPRDVEAVARKIETAEIPGVSRLEVTPVIGGHAGAILALELAGKRIGERQAEVCFVVGVDSYLDGNALDWLEADLRLAREGVRGGFTPGEGAGVLVVASTSAGARLGLPSLARVRGVATGQEPRAIDADEGLLGEGLTAVVKRASQGLRLPEERVEDTYCDINGERHRADEWCFAALATWQVFRDATAYTSGVGAWGDVGAATGALNCILAVQAWRRGYATGRRALVWGSSPAGLRGAAVLEQAGS